MTLSSRLRQPAPVSIKEMEARRFGREKQHNYIRDVGRFATFLGRSPTPPHARQDWRDLCARTAVRMLLIAGLDSQLWPCEHAAAAVAGNPLGRCGARRRVTRSSSRASRSRGRRSALCGSGRRSRRYRGRAFAMRRPSRRSRSRLRPATRPLHRNWTACRRPHDLRPSTPSV